MISADRKTILIVDDDVDILLALRKRLLLAGYRILSATQGDDALEQARTECVHAITLDVSMPGSLDGLSVAAALSKDPRTATIPIVFLTGSADGSFKDRCSDAGGKYFLAKPYDPDLLLRILDGIFAKDELGDIQRLSNAKRRQPV